MVNNLFGPVAIYKVVNAPFSIFLLRSNMVQIPSNFKDPARVDGAGEFGGFTRIVVPLSWPAFLTVGLVIGLSVWSEFLLAMIFLTNHNLFTAVTKYYNFSIAFSRNWGLTNTAAVMIITPLSILFLLLQCSSLEGLTQGGLKG